MQAPLNYSQGNQNIPYTQQNFNFMTGQSSQTQVVNYQRVYQTLQINRVIRYDELDQGFILRANEEVTRILRHYIRFAEMPPKKEKVAEAEKGEDEEMKEEEETKKQELNMELINLCKERRRYGVKLNRVVYLATLVDLPCIIEAMKTLDDFNFYKSQDASQMVYVHPKKINLDEVTREEYAQIIKDYDPIKEDPDFFQVLYERKKHAERAAKAPEENNEEKSGGDKDGDKESKSVENLKLRDGISPITKNIRNIRYKKKPKFDVEQVRKIEKMLKDHIDLGFADHVDE